MAAKKPSSLTALLSERDPRLKALAAEAHRLEALLSQVAKHLPAEAEPHCLGADLKAGVLTLFLDSGAWKTFLHYRQQELLISLRRALDQPCSVLKLKVLPEPVPGVPPKPPSKTLSADTQRLLESTAGSLEDTALAAALRRLARGRAPRS
jgi:hypothetical protein